MLLENNELSFLEVNANGQWVFLDIMDQYGLLNCVIDWLKRSASQESDAV